MGMFGKWLGGGLGFVLGGPIGGLIGFLFGTAVDENSEQFSTYTAEPGATTKGDFMMSLLVLVAAVMKADGKVVKSELNYVRQFFITQFGPNDARQAVLMLRDILKRDIPVMDVALQIRNNMNYSSRLQLLHLLFNLSMVDSDVHRSEIDILGQISGYLGISAGDFQSIRNMFVPETDSSYKILEIEPGAPDEEVKKAYRRMAMKYHPDKVSHLGEELRQSANEKFTRVNEAYERIKRERNLV